MMLFSRTVKEKPKKQAVSFCCNSFLAFHARIPFLLLPPFADRHTAEHQVKSSDNAPHDSADPQKPQGAHCLLISK